MNKLLTTFSRNNIVNNADLGEKIGNIGLGLLRIGFGKTVTVEKNSNNSDKPVFAKKSYSTIARVIAVALFILTLPLTILLAGIGCVGTVFSKSHKQIFNSYIQLNTQKSKPTSHVQVQKTRCRAFNKAAAPAEVGNLSSIEMKHPSEIKHNNTVQTKHVQFGDIRCRAFNKAAAPAEVGNLSSFVIGHP